MSAGGLRFAYHLPLLACISYKGYLDLWECAIIFLSRIAGMRSRTDAIIIAGSSVPMKVRTRSLIILLILGKQFDRFCSCVSSNGIMSLGESCLRGNIRKYAVMYNRTRVNAWKIPRPEYLHLFFHWKLSTINLCVWLVAGKKTNNQSIRNQTSVQLDEKTIQTSSILNSAVRISRCVVRCVKTNA